MILSYQDQMLGKVLRILKYQATIPCFFINVINAFDAVCSTTAFPSKRRRSSLKLYLEVVPPMQVKAFLSSTLGSSQLYCSSPGLEGHRQFELAYPNFQDWSLCCFSGL